MSESEFDAETKQIIEKIADSQAIPEGDVKEIYEEKLEQCEEGGLKGQEAEARARKLLWTTFKRKSQSSSSKIEGIILGAGDRYDAISYQRDDAISSYQSNPQKAIKDGEVAVACPPEEASNLTGNGVQVIGDKNGWSIVTHGQNEGILQYDFAERQEDGSVVGQDDGEAGVEEGWRLYPLDTREKFGSGSDASQNDRYGMPQPKHQWTRRGLGLFFTEEHEGVNVGILTFRGKASARNPPLFEPVQFQGRVNEGDQGDLFINISGDTDIEENPALEDKMNKTVDQLIETYFAGTDYYHNLESLYEYMAEQDGRRTVIVESDVVSMDLEANSNDTYRMVIGEMDFTGGELVEREATVWVPTWHDQYIDFAVDSRVYVIGQAKLQDAYNPETGERDSDEKEVVLNAQGLYADPTTKIPREDEVEELTEDDVQFDEAPDEPAGDGFDEDQW